MHYYVLIVDSSLDKMFTSVMLEHTVLSTVILIYVLKLVLVAPFCNVLLVGTQIFSEDKIKLLSINYLSTSAQDVM